MVEQLARALLVQTLTLAVACVAVRWLQLAVVRRLGAGAGYLAWLLVPVAMLAVALPHRAADALVIHVDVAAAMPAWVSAPLPQPTPHGNVAPAIAVAVWAAGVALSAALLLRRQRRFEALVARTQDGRAARLPAGTGPAVLGVWRRRIVLPRDFDTAFDADERRLMLAHEGVHLRRADNAWNLLASALLVVHWFNPIAWWAWRRLRADQELSCDAAVLRREPSESLASYANALLKVQGVTLAPPLATSWQSSHPLVERVRMLQVHRISAARHRAGLRVAALFVAIAGIGGYALRAGASAATDAVPGDKPAVLLSIDFDAGQIRRPITLTTDGDVTQPLKGANKPPSPTVLSRASERTTVRVAGDPAKHTLDSEMAFVATPLPDDRVQIDAELHYGDKLLGTPRVITHDGEPAHIEVKLDDDGHVFAVTLLPRLVRPAPAVPASNAAPAPPAPPAPPALAPAAPPAFRVVPDLPARPDQPPAVAPPAPPTYRVVPDLPAPPAPPQRAP